MKINNKTQITFALMGAAIIWISLSILRMLFPEGNSAGNFLEGLGGSSSGIIQFVCYALFIYTLQLMQVRNNSVVREYKAFDDKFLPERENYILSPKDVEDIKINVINREKEDQESFFIRSLIKKVSNQYRNNNSVVEAYQMLESQIKTAKDIEEANLEFTRYTLQAISMLGLVGTLIGLTQAIGKAHGMLQIDPVAKEQSLINIVSNFSMAFGTTLVAIILVLILTQRYHVLLSKLDIFYSRSENYIIDNLISRIYKRD